MSTSNEDLRVKIEQIDGKVNNVQAMVSDLKVTALGIASLERGFGEMRGDVRNALDGIARTAAALEAANERMRQHERWASQEKEKVEAKIAVIDRWKNWMMGGLTVMGLVLTALSYAVATLATLR